MQQLRNTQMGCLHKTIFNCKWKTFNVFWPFIYMTASTWGKQAFEKQAFEKVIQSARF